MIGAPLIVPAVACRCGWGRVHAAAIEQRPAPSARTRVRAAVAIGAVLLIVLSTLTIGLLPQIADLVASVLAIACLYLVWKSRPTRSKTRRLDAIVSAARHTEAGNLDIAARILSDAAGSDDVGDYARAALAICYLRQGQLGRAVCLLTDMVGEPRRRCIVVWHILQHALAYSNAVGGATVVAEGLRFAAIGLRHSHSPLRYVLLCKRRRFSEVATSSVRPDVRERQLRFGSALTDSQLGWHGERVVALLCAFALRQDGANKASPARVAPFFTAARPTYAGEYDYLLVDWPELRTFLEEHSDKLTVRTKVRVSPELPRAVAYERRG